MKILILQHCNTLQHTATHCNTQPSRVMSLCMSHLCVLRETWHFAYVTMTRACVVESCHMTESHQNLDGDYTAFGKLYTCVTHRVHLWWWLVCVSLSHGTCRWVKHIEYRECLEYVCKVVCMKIWWKYDIRTVQEAWHITCGWVVWIWGGFG